MYILLKFFSTRTRIMEGVLLETNPITPTLETEPVTKPPSKRKSTHPKRRPNVIPAVCFSRLVKQLTASASKKNKYIWSTAAMQALQESAELHMQDRFEKCGDLATLCNKHTVTPEIFNFKGISSS